MSSEQPLQGNCDQCGGLLEFPVEWLGAQVACPLCGETTELRVESIEAEAVPSEVDLPPLEEEFVVEPPKTARRWPLIVGASVGVILLLGCVAAWFVWKSRSEVKVSATKPLSSSVAAVEESVLVVAPTLGIYQGGMKAEELRAGRELFVSRCSECHNLHDPATYSASEWGGIFSSMRGKAKLSGEQAEQINRFLASVRP